MQSALKLTTLEKELKKRLIYPYYWGRYQNNTWDKSTRYIYKTFHFNDLITQIKVHFNLLKPDTSFVEYFNYAINRWYNFWSAKAVEQMFTVMPDVKSETNHFNKEVDFYIHGIPFDHKTSIFPKGYTKQINEAVKNPDDLSLWLYKNQSHQGREHFKNRLFVVLYQKDGKHWQLKAELNLIKNNVEKYVKNFMADNLICHNFKAEKDRTLTDIIFVIK